MMDLVQQHALQLRDRNGEDEPGVVIERDDVAGDRDAHRAHLGPGPDLESLQDLGVEGILVRQAGDAQTDPALGPLDRRVDPGHGYVPFLGLGLSYPRSPKNARPSSRRSPGRSPRNTPRFVQAAW